MLRFKLSERIADKEFKERRRITIQEMSEATGINRMTLSKLLNKHGANVQTENLDRLCEYFGCAIEELVEFIPDSSK
jgi:putative transcriptional regulator